MSESSDAFHLRAAAAAKYKPPRTNVLFIAEAPPSSEDRYFYFERVSGHDWLFIALMKSLFPCEFGKTKVERLRKAYWLSKFKDAGFQLTDAVERPISGSNKDRIALIAAALPALADRVRMVQPDRIVLIKSTVFTALAQELVSRGFDVVNRTALPFPSSGQQRNFHERLTELAQLPNAGLKR